MRMSQPILKNGCVNDLLKVKRVKKIPFKNVCFFAMICVQMEDQFYLFTFSFFIENREEQKNEGNRCLNELLNTVDVSENLVTEQKVDYFICVMRLLR